MTPEPRMSFVGMKKYPFPLFGIKTEPAWKKRSPGHSILRATYVVYQKLPLIGIKLFEM